MLKSLAADICTGNESAEALVAEALTRIERLNPALNAVVRLRPEAVADAHALDARLAAGRLGADAIERTDLPLAGLPFLVKDVEDVVGLPTTHASLLFLDAPPATADSGTVARLRAAGAIPVGKSNTSEFAFEGVTDNRLFGRTLNPWNRDWSPGGSSGGSAAALAAGLVPIATATDAGGSSRGPAAVCGLVGLKPTNGLIGRANAPAWLDLATDGIMGTSVADVELLLAIMAGPQPGDASAAREWRPDPAPGLPERFLVAPRIQAGGPLPPDVDALFRTAVARLESDVLVPLEEIAPERIFPGPHHPDDDSLVLLGPETVSWLGRTRAVTERDRLDPFFERYLDEALGVTLDEYLAARRRRFDHARALDSLLGDDRVLVTPTLNISGLLADGSTPGGAEPTNGAANTNPHNVTGHPAISVPAGILPNGLPFGLMFTGPRFRDALLLRVAATWERIAPWPLTAPGHAPFGWGG